MDARGIGLALKILIFIAVLSLVALVANVFGVKQPTTQPAAPGTPSPTVTPTPTVSGISSDADVDKLSVELDSMQSDLDAIDQDLSDVDKSLSTSDIDKDIKDLDTMN